MADTSHSTKFLIRQSRKGNREALSELLGRHEDRLLGWIRRFLFQRRSNIDPRDVLQDVYLHVVTHPDRFEPRFSGAFSCWMKRIAQNKIRNAQRKKKELGIEPLVSESGTLKVQGREKTPSSSVSVKEAHRVLWESLNSLPKEQRQVLWLRDYEELSFDEIALKMGKPTADAAAKYYWRTVEKLGKVYRAVEKP